MDSLIYLAFTFFLFIVSLAYFRLARSYKIVDLPNHRTMHQGATIRGGGVVILIAMVTAALYLGHPGFYFLIGLTLIGLTGLLDDLIDLSSKIRFPLQMISVMLILLELDLLDIHWFLLLTTVVIGTGILNAFNFMDGINGMTAGYSLVLASTFILINYSIREFVSAEFLYLYMLALVVFGFFNFRKKAVCFAGDVGSLTIAFINLYLMMKLIQETGEIAFIFFLSLYGMDTVFTIVQRMFNRENIFEAHNKHFFQVAVRKLGFSHVQMSGIYMFIQAMINVIVILSMSFSAMQQTIVIFVLLGLLSVVYVFLKFKLINSTR